MSKIRIPKWGTVLGLLVAVSDPITNIFPAVIKAVPVLQHSAIAVGILGIAGAIVAAYGTPMHANTPAGGVVKDSEPPIESPVA